MEDILSSVPRHTWGVKVRLTDGQIGRVQEIEPAEPPAAPGRPEEGADDAA